MRTKRGKRGSRRGGVRETARVSALSLCRWHAARRYRSSDGTRLGVIVLQMARASALSFHACVERAPSPSPLAFAIHAPRMAPRRATSLNNDMLSYSHERPHS